jgi:hypothetical protein
MWYAVMRWSENHGGLIINQVKNDVWAEHQTAVCALQVT